MALAIGGSALLGAGAAKSAAKTQAAATDRAGELQKETVDQQIALQREMFNKQMELQRPYQEAGVNALNKLQGMADYTMFGPEQFTKDPGYGFRLAEGQKALDRQAAARGGLISGGALKAAQRYGQDMGSQEYSNAFNRYQLERAAKLGPYQSLAGVGQTAANTMGANAGQFGANVGNTLGAYGTNVGNLMTSGGAARASGYVGGANALTSGLGQYMNYTQSQNLMNRLLPQTGGSPTAMPYSPLYQSQIPGAGV
jgi:hypothetical protein